MSAATAARLRVVADRLESLEIIRCWDIFLSRSGIVKRPFIIQVLVLDFTRFFQRIHLRGMGIIVHRMHEGFALGQIAVVFQAGGVTQKFLVERSALNPEYPFRLVLDPRAIGRQSFVAAWRKRVATADRRNVHPGFGALRSDHIAQGAVGSIDRFRSGGGAGDCAQRAGMGFNCHPRVVFKAFHLRPHVRP